MTPVVWTVDVLAIPASGEGDGCANPPVTKTFGETLAVSFAGTRCTGIVTTAVAQLSLLTLGRLQSRVTNKHTKPGFEGGNLGHPIVRRDVIDSHTSILLGY